MTTLFDWKHEVGEMIGSFILVFAIMLSILIVKRKSFGIDTTFKKRLFLGTTVALSVILAATATLGFGGHGQINPAVTVLVAAIEGAWMEVPAVIGFQFIGALAATGAIFLFAKQFAKDVKLEEAYTFNKQTVAKTMTMEIMGNILWLLPIGALVVIMLNNHSTTALNAAQAANSNLASLHDGGFGHFELFLVAAAGKFLLIAVFEEFGAAAFNPIVWFSKVLLATIALKKITMRALGIELTAAGTSMAVGVGVGFFSHLFVVA